MCAKENSADPPRPGTWSTRDSRAFVVYDILRTASYLRRSYGDFLLQRGITFPQYNVVRILRGAGPGGLPTLEIAERMIDETPGITRLLDRLEAKKLIRRERPSNNRRQVICYATQKGLDLLQELDAPLRARVKTSSRELSNADVEKLLEFLGRLRNEE
jgi:MarR family transcriptional regulator, organic hydroperoxide resistance regulator